MPTFRRPSSTSFAHHLDDIQYAATKLPDAYAINMGAALAYLQACNHEPLSSVHSLALTDMMVAVAGLSGVNAGPYLVFNRGIAHAYAEHRSEDLRHILAHNRKRQDLATHLITTVPPFVGHPLATAAATAVQIIRDSHIDPALLWGRILPKSHHQALPMRAVQARVAAAIAAHLPAPLPS